MRGIISVSPRTAEAIPVTDFLLRDLEPHVLEQLRRRAEDHGRSLQAEIHDTLRRSVHLSKAESIDLLEQHRTLYPSLSEDSTALIREDRDSR